MEHENKQHIQVAFRNPMKLVTRTSKEASLMETLCAGGEKLAEGRAVGKRIGSGEAELGRVMQKWWMRRVLSLWVKQKL